MRAARITTFGKVFTDLLSRFFGAGLVFVLSPILLFVAGSSPEGGSYASMELGFSLLALAGTSGCVAGLIFNAYRLLDNPLRIGSPLVRLPKQPEPSPRAGYDKREQALPVMVPSLILPTLISGLGGWVESFALAPRAEARLFAA